MNLDASQVMAAARAWLYVPPGCPEVMTGEFRLIAHPPTWANPTEVHRIDSRRPAAELVDAVLAAAEGLGRTDVTFWTHPDTRPPDLVEHLLTRGAVRHEELAVLARPLAALSDLPYLAVPDDVDVRPADDVETLRDLDRIGVTVFGGSLSTDEALLAEHTGGLGVGAGVVAHRDGVAVGCAGLTVRDGVARLWGGAVLPEARGTGVYRALLAHRLQVGVREGCTIALVKGRPTSSAPILHRAGFEQYGQECSYRLATAP